MSAATNMVYEVSQDALGEWSFEALDWDRGESVFKLPYGRSLIYCNRLAIPIVGIYMMLD